MNGSAFIDCAHIWLANSSAGEAVLRSAVSRAYYGAFHRSQEFLEHVLRIRMEKGPTQHTKIPKALGFTGATEIISIGHRLEDLKNRRHSADYRIADAKAGSRQIADLAIQDAQSIRSTLDRFAAAPSTLAEMQARIATHFKLSLTGWDLIEKLGGF